MDRREFLVAATSMAGLALVAACGGASGPAPGAPPDAAGQEPLVFEWSLGGRGGSGGPGAFVTQEVWEPKRIVVPAGRPFKLRFVPRDERLHTISFDTTLAAELGQAPADLVVDKGQPVETPVHVIKTADKAFNVFCREHSGTGGFGSIITV
jgi:plastocyanin